jgi:hypothetical protein
VTITTVGYGDRFAVTNTGRLVGVFVTTAGVGLFGRLSGFLAYTFLSPRGSKGSLRKRREMRAVSRPASQRRNACWTRRNGP